MALPFLPVLAASLLLSTEPLREYQPPPKKKPSHARRAKVKAARKQNRKK